MFTIIAEETKKIPHGQHMVFLVSNTEGFFSMLFRFEPEISPVVVGGRVVKAFQSIIERAETRGVSEYIVA